MADYLLYQSARLDKSKMTTLNTYKQKVIEYTKNFPQHNTYNTVLALRMMSEKERSDFIIRHYPQIEALPIHLKKAVKQSLGESTEAATAVGDQLVDRALKLD